MNDDQRFILALALSAIILVGFQFLHGKQPVLAPTSVTQVAPKSEPVAAIPLAATSPDHLEDRSDLLAATSRVSIETPELKGSINLKGALLDDLQLVQYHESLAENSPRITLLSPSGSAAPHLDYHAEFGWLSTNKQLLLPKGDTVWQSSRDPLTPSHEVTLTWENGAGLSFKRVLAVDENYMFSVTDQITNNSKESLNLFPFALVARQGEPVSKTKSSVIHEGPLGVINGTLKEYKYTEMAKSKKIDFEGEGGWFGITDKYWLVALVPDQSEKLATKFSYQGPEKYDPDAAHFQVDYRGDAEALAPGATLKHQTRFFAGAKRIKLLDHYAKIYNIPKFDRAIDFGWFFFLTIPFLHLLEYLGNTLGSFGIAILVFTVMLKLITLPLSLKSYHSMAKMKALQPEMVRLQERYKDDKAQQGKEMMALYAREKVSPVSGCVPTIIQIPIFFALYKVLYVSLELRQAPFYGWIKDMSAPDPTSLFTLFGLIPWMPPTFLQLGAWPLLMGCSMFLQQKLSPQPPDKAQAQMFALMPIMFTFMLAQMPAGLVIYWTWSNLLGIAQQWYIMRGDANKKGKLTQA